jgi:hypothetical protein
VLDAIGWIATALFAASYFVRDSGKMRIVQAFAAARWIAYGVLLHALPIIVANVIVASLALYSAWRPAPQREPVEP